MRTSISVRDTINQRRFLPNGAPRDTASSPEPATQHAGRVNTLCAPWRGQRAAVESETTLSQIPATRSMFRNTGPSHNTISSRLETILELVSGENTSSKCRSLYYAKHRLCTCIIYMTPSIEHVRLIVNFLEALVKTCQMPRWNFTTAQRSHRYSALFCLTPKIDQGLIYCSQTECYYQIAI